MKPISVVATLAADRLETAMNVGSTPSMTHGWRPTSATNQPSSAAIQGNGRVHSATYRNAAVCLQRATGREIERDGEQGDEEEAERDHEAETPEQRRDVGHGAPRRLRDLGVGGVDDVGSFLLQEQGIAEIVGVVGQTRSSAGVGAVGPQFLQRVIGDEAGTDARLASATSSLMPGTSPLIERVAMRPSIQGTFIAKSV